METKRGHCITGTIRTLTAEILSTTSLFYTSLLLFTISALTCDLQGTFTQVQCDILHIIPLGSSFIPTLPFFFFKYEYFNKLSNILITVSQHQMITFCLYEAKASE